MYLPCLLTPKSFSREACMHHEISFIKCLKERDVECGIMGASCSHCKAAACVFVQTVTLTCEYIVDICAARFTDLCSEFIQFVFILNMF